MRKLSKDLYLVDYVKDTLKDITKAEIARLKLLLRELNETYKLCSETGRAVVAEFEFKGNLENVRDQLSDLIDGYKTNKLKENDRVILMANSDRLRNYQLREREDFYRKKSRDTVITDLEAAGKYIEALGKRREVLHKKKECLCYCN